MEDHRPEGELPERLACLELLEECSKNITPVIEEGGRVLRKRKAPDAVPTSNRRVQAPPRKRLAGTDDVRSLYLDKKIKLSTRALETIPEDSDSEGRKLKRQITFATGGRMSKEKILKRRKRIKKMLSNAFLSRNKIPMHVFMQSLQGLELD